MSEIDAGVEHGNDTAPFFSSARERRLWAWTLAIVTTIYATLGLARTLAGAMGDGVAAAAMLFSMFLIGVAVLTQGLTIRPRVADVAVALGIAAVYVMVPVRMMIVTERSHLIEYAVVALFIHEALRERARQGRRVPVPALLAIVATSLVGVIDEGIQLLLPDRVFDPVDMLFNTLAAVMAVAASTTLAWVRGIPMRRRQA